MENLKSTTWPAAVEAMKKCHLSELDPMSVTLGDWGLAFRKLVLSIKDERTYDPGFAPEITRLTEDTGSTYDFKDILEEYFDYLEKEEAWEDVIRSSDIMLELFKWQEVKPSEYMYRKGNALQHLKRYDEAEAFGKKWLEEYPDDLYAAASNVFLKVLLNKYDEAKAITEKYLSEDLICNNETDTFFMAAFRLYEVTSDINAKKRVEEKMAEYTAIVSKREQA